MLNYMTEWGSVSCAGAQLNREYKWMCKLSSGRQPVCRLTPYCGLYVGTPLQCPLGKYIRTTYERLLKSAWELEMHQISAYSSMLKLHTWACWIIERSTVTTTRCFLSKHFILVSPPGPAWITIRIHLSWCFIQAQHLLSFNLGLATDSRLFSCRKWVEQEEEKREVGIIC